MMDTIENQGFRTIREIRERNEEAGLYFFSPKTMKFFASRVIDGVYGGGYFITSEQYKSRFDGAKESRKYTVRMARPSGDIATIGDFNVIPTLREAKKIAKGLGLVTWLREGAEIL